MSGELMGRPSRIAGRKSLTYFPGAVGLPGTASPPMLSKSWTITADIEVPDDQASGMIVPHGGLGGGYGLYRRDGKPTFVYNDLAIERPTFAAKHALPKGKGKLVVEFMYDGGGLGKGGTVTMSANGAMLAGGRLERTVPVQFSINEGVDIGTDVGSAVVFIYKLPFKFTGKIENVAIDLK